LHAESNALCIGAVDVLIAAQHIRATLTASDRNAPSDTRPVISMKTIDLLNYVSTTTILCRERRYNCSLTDELVFWRQLRPQVRAEGLPTCVVLHASCSHSSFGPLSSLSTTFSGVARGEFGGFKPPIEKCQKKIRNKIVENTQSCSLHVLKRHQTTSLALTDLQILGCEMPENAFGFRAPPGPAGEL